MNNYNISIAKTLFILLLISFISYNLNAQYAYLSSYNGSYYSDYYVYFRYYDFQFNCDCSNGAFTSKVNINGGSYINLGSTSGTSYSGNDKVISIGPSKSFEWNMRLEEGGGDGKFLGICWYGCGYYYYYPSNRSYTTSGIRPPESPVASQKKYDYRIDISWGKTTDIPDNQHGYIIYRDGFQIAIVNGDHRHYEDMGLGAGENHTYTIHTIYPPGISYALKSSGVSVTGTTFDLELDATNDQKDIIDLTWNHLKDIPGKDGASLEKYLIYRYDEENDNNKMVAEKSIDWNSFSDESIGLIPGYAYKYTLVPMPDDKFYSDSTWGKTLPNGKISGKVTTLSDMPVVNTKVCAIRQDTVPQDTTTIYCDFTDNAGNFEIDNIYYYLESNFKIMAIREGHGFQPAYEEHSLDTDIPSVVGLLFRDTSAVTVTGKVVQQGNNGMCPVEGVGIYVDENEEPDAITDEDGIYLITLDEIDNYTFTAKLDTHSFSPNQINANIQYDSVLVDIIDTTKFTLSGYVNASCNSYIGRADLHITSNTCFDTVIKTDTLTGYYEIELPARKYSISLVKFYSEDGAIMDEDVESYFEEVTVDLTFGDVEYNFIYRMNLEVTTEFANYGCDSYENIPIVLQGVRDTMYIKIREAYGESSCFVQDGFVVIQNHLGNEAETVDTLEIIDGIVTYSFIPGYPNIIDPYFKDLTISAHLQPEIITESFDVLVIGNHPRTQTFTTVSPEIPLLILRDPPGDGSSSYFEENTTTETAIRFSAEQSGSINAWAQVKAGVKFEAGFGVTVETEIWGSIKGSLEVGAAITGQDEFTLSITNGEIFSTSGNDNIIGESGDVFVGSALNIIYALTDVIEYDAKTCSVNKSVKLSMGVDGFATTYIYTQSYIENIIIPQLSYIQKLYEQNDNDSAVIYANQIDVWRQTLKLNEDLKEKSKPIKDGNVSFSSGVVKEMFTELGSSKSSSIEYKLYIDAGVAIEAGVEVGGVGFSGGVEIKTRTEFGKGTTVTSTKTHKTGFILQDDDDLDGFTLDICADEVYGTPVFKLLAGSSSCPWEPGTQPRDGVQLISDSYLQNVKSPDGQAVFSLQLANISQSDEKRTYQLVFDQSSNPDGAKITIGGSQAQSPIDYTIEPGESKNATVTVERGPLAFDYNNLMFRMYPECDESSIADTVFLDVHFKNECSDIYIIKPLNEWAISSNDKDQLKITISGYDKSKLNSVKLQLANDGVFNWRTIESDTSINLNPVETTFTADLELFEDGNYLLRALVSCEAGKNYSTEIPGIIDRTGPELYGLPEPADLVLDSTDLISVKFNEDIDCYEVSSALAEVTNLSEDIILNATVGCNGDEIFIIPDFEDNDFTGDTLNVQITGIKDKVGNVMSETVSWSFVVADYTGPLPDADTDLDEILNGIDNCPYTYNPGQEDTDLDGIGDYCDNDMDDDDVVNNEDNCLKTSNTSQSDADLDGIGDACDFDTDNDLVIDDIDNCPSTPNADQADFNKDGIGDACQTVNIVHPVEDAITLITYPNPFERFTTFTIDVNIESDILIKIHDVLGNEVEVIIDEKMYQGKHKVIWDAQEYGNGIYFCSVYVKHPGDHSIAKKTIMLIKQE